MSIGKELDRLSRKTLRENASSIVEANIVGLGSDGTKYKIKLRNGTIINDVLGNSGLSVGTSVSVGVYPGKLHRYVILGSGYKSTGIIKEIWV